MAYGGNNNGFHWKFIGRALQLYMSIIGIHLVKGLFLTISCALAWITESTVPVINTVPFLCVPFGSGKEMLRRKEKLSLKLQQLALYVFWLNDIQSFLFIKCSWLPIIQTFTGTRDRLELLGVQVIKRWVQVITWLELREQIGIHFNQVFLQSKSKTGAVLCQHSINHNRSEWNKTKQNKTAHRHYGGLLHYTVIMSYYSLQKKSLITPWPFTANLLLSRFALSGVNCGLVGFGHT